MPLQFHDMQVTVIDFTVTPAGLEDQLLGRLVMKEKRELEQQRRKLVEEVMFFVFFVFIYLISDC